MMIRNYSVFVIALCFVALVESDTDCSLKTETVATWSQDGQRFYADPAFDLTWKFSTRNLGSTPLGGLDYTSLKGGCVSGPYLNGTVDFGYYSSVIRLDGYSKVEGKVVVETDSGSFVGLDFYGLQSAAPSQTDYFVLGVKIRAPDASSYTGLNRLMFVGRVMDKNDKNSPDKKWILRVFAIKDQPVGFVAPQVPFHFNLHSSGNGSVAKFWMVNDLLDQRPLYGSTINGIFADGRVLIPGVAGDFITYRNDQYYEPDTLYVTANNASGTPTDFMIYETTGVVGPISNRSYYYQVSALYADPQGPNGGVVKKRFLTKGRLGVLLGPNGQPVIVNGQPVPWLWFDHYSIEVV